MKRIVCLTIFFLFLSMSVGSLLWADELTLDQAIELALEKNPSLLAARYNASAASWGLGQAVSGWLPHVYLNSSWSRPDEDTLDRADKQMEFMKQFSPDAKPSLFENNYSSSIQVVQPIFNGGREYVAIHSAVINRDSAQLTADDAYLQIVLEVKKTYYEAMKTKALQRVAHESLALAQQSLKLAQARRDVGQATESDVLRWEAEEANAEGNVASAESGYALAIMALVNVIGEPIGQTFELPEMDVTIDPASLLQAEQAAGVGSDQPLHIGEHPAVQVQSNQIDLAQVGTAQSVGALLPNVNFSYTYSWETNDTPELDGDNAWTMGIGVEIPLFQSFGAAAGIGQSCRRQQATRQTVEAYNRGFLQRSHAAQLNLRASRLRVVSALKAEKASSANLKIVESREALGMANYLELLDAQLAYKTAQSNLISAISDFNSSLSEWEYVSANAEQTAE